MRPGAHKPGVPKLIVAVPKPLITRGQDTLNEINWDSAALKAFCVCGKKMLSTTSKEIKNGIQPRCPNCPPTKE